MSVFETRGLTKRFGALRVTNDINLTLDAGERRAIVGPNGAGKTTLFNLLTGWLKPDAGEVLFEGAAITHMTPDALARRGISRSFQKNMVFDNLTVFENIRLAVQAQDRSARNAWTPFTRYREVMARAAEIAATVDLTEKLDERASALSYGQRRQLEVALALAGRPRLLMMDEPAAGASPVERRKLAELVRGLPRSITVLLVEHDMDLVFELCDRITVLVHGEELITGRPDEIRGHPLVREAYLGSAHA